MLLESKKTDLRAFVRAIGVAGRLGVVAAVVYLVSSEPFAAVDALKVEDTGE